MESPSVKAKSLQEKHTRDQWRGKLDFLMAALCCVLGLGDVSTFPLLIYTNGGGAFVLPYLCCVISVGIPTLFLELKMGQFSSSGLLKSWDFCPLLSGCGVAMIILSSVMGVYYNILVAWGIYYFVSSFSLETPWAKCGNWSTRYCIDNVRLGTKFDCYQMQWTIRPNGLCEPPNGSNVLWIWSEAVARRNNIILTYPTLEYVRPDSSLQHGDTETLIMTSVNTHVVMSLVIAWIIVWILIALGIRISSKVILLVTIFPYLILFGLLLRGFTLPGAKEGILYFLAPDATHSSIIKVWNDAIRQACFSMSVAYGGLVVLASYNKFHYDIVRDTLILPTVDSIVGILAGLVIFSHLGFLAQTMRVEIEGLAKGGPLLVFEVLPYVLSKLGWANFWSGVFFLMIIVMGLNSQRIIMETVVSGVVDLSPDLRRRKYIISFVICLFMFICGLPMTTSEGLNIFNLLFASSGGLNVLVLVFLENFAVSWIYGVDRFIRDIETMTGSRYCYCFMFGHVCRMWWKLCWKFLVPFTTLIFIAMSIPSYNEYEYTSWWAPYICWSVTGSCMGIILAVGLYRLLTATGTVKERCKEVISPTREWGPVLKKHRQLVKYYIPKFVVDPQNVDSPESDQVTMPQSSELVQLVWNNVEINSEVKKTDQQPGSNN